MQLLTIGFHPEVPGPASPEELRARLRELGLGLWALGHQLDSCFVTGTAEDEATVAAALRARRHDAICIGAGLRLLPQHTELFEKILNLVHREAPHARLCFNSGLSDALAAFQRALAP